MSRSNTAFHVEKPTFAEKVAQLAVRDTLLLTPKSATHRFVAALVAPDPADCEIYEEGALRYLSEYIAIELQQKKTCNAEVERRDPLTKLRVYGHFEFFVLVLESRELISSEVRLVTDRVGDIHEPVVEHFIEAAQALFGIDLTSDDAVFLATQPLSAISLAFTKGRRPSLAIKKLRDHVKRMSREKTPIERTQKSDRTLHDLPGYGEAKSWGLRLASDLSDWSKGKIDWQDVDKGLVLVGPPGVGKTVFARALAATCGVPLIHASAAKWQANGHLGDMLKAMRRTFAEGRDQAPAIVFIDELDSIPDREAVRGDNADYARQVTNGFLEQLDGSDVREGVVVVAATNRIENVDSAVLRSGRLERIIEIGLPDVADRNAILRLNLPTLPPGRSARFDELTAGWSGADLERLARDVSRGARASGAELSFDLVEKVMPEAIAFDDQTRYRMSVHEAGHALVAILIGDADVKSIAVRRNRFTFSNDASSGGVVEMAEVSYRPRTRAWYESRTAIAMGGVAAEVLVLGDHADGAGGAPTSDLEQANYLATCLVSVFAMDGLWSSAPTMNPHELRELRHRMPEARHRIERIVGEQLRRATFMLEQERAALIALADAVFDEGQLEHDKIMSIVAMYSSAASTREADAMGASQ